MYCKYTAIVLVMTLTATFALEGTRKTMTGADLLEDLSHDLVDQLNVAAVECSECKLPFEYQSESYSKCITKDGDGQPWCELKKGSWGWCKSGCDATGSASQSQCSTTDNIGYRGLDLMRIEDVSDSSACCAACGQTNGCKAWTYGKDNQKCWLKSAVPSETSEKSSRISGTLTEAAPPAAKPADVARAAPAAPVTPAPVTPAPEAPATAKAAVVAVLSKFKCKTDKGDCQIPFLYDGLSHDKCTEKGSPGKPWCYTNDQTKTWGYCPDDCKEKETPAPVPASCSKANDDDDSSYNDTGGKDEFTVPLYMFKADSGRVATLTAKAKLNTLNKRTCEKYSKLFNGPIGFISKTNTGKKKVGLYAYWDSKTQDMFTGTQDPSAWGGSDYKHRVLLGYIAWNAFEGDAPGAAPVYWFYNKNLKNYMVAPFTSAKEVNDLVSGNGWKMATEKFYLGNMAKGTCDACYTELSRTYGNPSGGCPASAGRLNMGIIWDLSGSGSGISGIQKVANEAVRLMKGYGSLKKAYPQSEFHMAFNYFCGLSGDDASKIKSNMNNCGVNWTPKVKFKGLSYEYNKYDKFAMVAVLDDESEAKMQKAGKAWEQCLKEHGVNIKIPRAHQWSYHITLAQVQGVNKYAGSEAVRDINKKLDWSSATADLSDAGTKSSQQWCKSHTYISGQNAVCYWG